MPPYTPTAYLLDRAHITDTILKLYHLTDTSQWTRLGSGDKSEVFAPTFTLDYTAMFGGTPTQRSPADVVALWTPIMAKMKATTHVQSGVLIEELPVPLGSEAETGEGGSEEGKGQAKSKGEGDAEGVILTARVSAYVTVHLVKTVAGEDKMTSNGGISHYDVAKFSEEKCRGLYGEGWDGNPWRVTRMRVEPRWYAGDKEIILGEST
jgi:hypothetical protein